MPDDVQVLPASPDDVATRPLKSVARAAETFSENSLREAADIIANAQFPVILMGRGCRGSAHKVEELAEMLGCPIMTTYPAKGIITSCRNSRNLTKTENIRFFPYHTAVIQGEIPGLQRLSASAATAEPVFR